MNGKKGKDDDNDDDEEGERVQKRAKCLWSTSVVREKTWKSSSIELRKKKRKILKGAVMENNRPETEDDHFLKFFFAYNTHTHTHLCRTATLFPNSSPVAIISEGNDKSEITKYN